MKPIKQPIWLYLLLFVLIPAFSFYSCGVENKEMPMPIGGDSRPYINGEVLLPDYSHDDTLQVINADELNRIFDGVDITILPGTDSEIDSALHLYCVVIKKTEGLIKTKYVCPDCGQWGCIYEDIDESYDEATGNDINAAIYEVCKQKGITDSATINLLKANYNL